MNIFFRVTCFPRLSERWLIFFPRWSSVCFFFGTIMLAGYFFHNHPLLSSRLKSQMSTPKGEGIMTSLCMGNNRLHFHAVSSIRLFKICCIMTKKADKISVSVVHKQHFGVQFWNFETSPVSDPCIKYWKNRQYIDCHTSFFTRVFHYYKNYYVFTWWSRNPQG